jgi:sugar (pentulose or hexulose) kinase
LKTEIVEDCGLGNTCPVTMGIHDSNANLVPYLAKGFKDFVLNSTGTWCVGMRQSQTADFTDDEIRAKVLYNLDAFGKPLKTSIFPAGMEYDTFRGFTAEKDAGDFAAVRDVVARKDTFVIPGVLPDATAFPGATARVVSQGKVHTLDDLGEDPGKPMSSLGQTYFAALDLSLALATRQMLERCGAQPGTTVFVEGGFANNPIYCSTLAALCPDNPIALTSMKEGTSFGAAVTAWMAAEQCSLDAVGQDFGIETETIEVENFGDLDGYASAFEALLLE